VNTTLYKYKKLETWIEDLSIALGELGFRFLKQREGIFAYQNLTSTTLKGIEQSDGFMIVREPIGKGEWALGIKDHRKYFETGTHEPVKKSEQVLFNGAPAKYPRPAQRVRACAELGAKLAEVLPDFSNDPLIADDFEKGVYQKSNLIFGNGERPIDPQIGRNLKFNGFFESPKNFKIYVLANDVTNSIVREYSVNIENGIRNYGLSGKVKRISFSDADKLVSSDFISGPVGLVALAGMKGEAMGEDELRVMDHLDSCNASYRMFSLKNPELFWSSLDQVGTLAMLAGGAPYRMNFNWPEGTSVYSIGVDLGHPLHGGPSVLAVSLMGPDGVHLNTFTRVQKRDETADAKNLFEMLRESSQLAQLHAGSSEPEFLVLRDGRRNPGEDIYSYRKALGKNMTLVDISKRVNAYVYDSSNFMPGCAGDVLYFGDEKVPLAVTAPSATSMQIPTVRKIRVDRGWDGLGLGIEKVTEVICAMAYSPALGLKPHGNPGPVYWADGAASISPDNCHFRGIKEIKGNFNKLLASN
jgi:hypothetical protein